MSRVYPHKEYALLGAHQGDTDLVERMKLLYCDLHGADIGDHQFDYTHPNFVAEIKYLLEQYRLLFNEQFNVESASKLIALSLRERVTLLDNISQLENDLLGNAHRVHGFDHYRNAEGKNTLGYVKQLLERNFLLLKKRCEEKPKEGQTILIDCLSEFTACSAGMVGHLSNIETRLQSQQNILFWLAQLRGTLPDRYMSFKNIYWEQDIHIQLLLHKIAANAGMNLFKHNFIDNILPLRANTKFHHDFYDFIVREYTAMSMVECVATNLQPLLNDFNELFIQDENGWIELKSGNSQSDRAVEFGYINRQASIIAQALKISEEHQLSLHHLYELNAAGTHIRLKPELTANPKKYITRYLYKAGLLTMDQKNALSRDTLCATAQFNTNLNAQGGEPTLSEEESSESQNNLTNNESDDSSEHHTNQNPSLLAQTSNDTNSIAQDDIQASLRGERMVPTDRRVLRAPALAEMPGFRALASQSRAHSEIQTEQRVSVSSPFESGNIHSSQNSLSSPARGESWVREPSPFSTSSLALPPGSNGFPRRELLPLTERHIDRVNPLLPPRTPLQTCSARSAWVAPPLTGSHLDRVNPHLLPRMPLLGASSVPAPLPALIEAKRAQQHQETIIQKLNRIVIPRLKFKNPSISSMLGYGAFGMILTPAVLYYISMPIATPLATFLVATTLWASTTLALQAIYHVRAHLKYRAHQNYEALAQMQAAPSNEEKLAFKAGTMAQADVREQAQSCLLWNAYRHPVAYYAGMQAALVDDQDLVRKMKLSL